METNDLERKWLRILTIDYRDNRYGRLIREAQKTNPLIIATEKTFSIKWAKTFTIHSIARDQWFRQDLWGHKWRSKSKEMGSLDDDMWLYFLLSQIRNEWL